MNYSRFLFCVGFCLLIAVAASVKAGSDYRCPPVFNDSKHRLVYDHCDSASFTFKATPPKSRRGEYPADGIIRYRQLKGPGALDSVSGYWSMPAGSQVEWYNSLVLVEAYWQSIPSLKTRTGLILFPKNQMPVVVLDGIERRDTIPIPFGELYTLPIGTYDHDECDQPVVSYERVRPQPSGTVELLETENGYNLTFLPNPEDSGRFFHVLLKISDGYKQNHFKFTFAVVAPEDDDEDPEEEIFTSLGLSLNAVRDIVPGQIAELNLSLDSISQQQGIGGFDLTFRFDSAALSIAEVLPGALYDSCAWEYFTYTNAPGQVHLVGIAETNNGDLHPSCGAPTLPVTVARLRFLVGSDSSWACRFAPVRFYWSDCADNSISSASGNHLFGVERLFELQDSVFVELPASGAVLPGVGGLPLVGCDSPIRKIVLYSGGVGIACPEPVAETPGDVDMNAVPFEVEDFRLFGRYFANGPSVFTVDPVAQGNASDINQDGSTLAIEDYVLLYRRMSALDTANVLPPNSSNVASFFINAGMLLCATSDTLGAVQIVLAGNVTPQLLATGMSMQTSARNGSTYVVLSPKENFPNATFFRAGPLLRILTTTTIQSVATATKYGGKVTSQIGQTMVNAALTDGPLPNSYELQQNYPNPFNGGTVIRFDLPHGGDVSLEIFNVLGKVVYRHEENLSSGSHQFAWDGKSSDGSDIATGVYYYRLTSGSFTATKKMMYLK
ncbi:MAG: T9SS type A sorting domain-containing protein [bacterium]|nr:T9SS type A sorting domain-containing protein [bacterium]